MVEESFTINAGAAQIVPLAVEALVRRSDAGAHGLVVVNLFTCNGK